MREVSKYKILTFTRYLGDSFFYPFFSLFLENQGLVKGKIGFILSISPLIGIITNPLYATICKNPNITKKVLSIVSILEAIIIVLLPFCRNFYLISGLTILLALFGSCHYGLMDSLLAYFSNNNQINYSSIRLFGSTAYIIGTTVGGFIIKLISFQICFTIACVLFVLAGVLYFVLQPVSSDTFEKKARVNILSLFRVKEFVLFLVLYTLLMGTTNAGDYFFSVYLNSRGLSSQAYGMVYSYYVVIEVLLLALFSKFSSKIDNNKLLIIGAFCLCVRFLINGLYAPIWAVVIASGLRGVTYAIILHVSFQLVVKILGNNKATGGIMLITLCQAIFVFIFNNVDGNLIEATSSYMSYYFLMFGFGVLTFVLAIIRYFTIRPKELNE